MSNVYRVKRQEFLVLTLTYDFEMDSYQRHLKADPDLTQDIAYIYEILHCNHFIILSNATAYEIVVASYALALL